MKKNLLCFGLFALLSTTAIAQKQQQQPMMFGHKVDLKLAEEANGHIKCASYEYEQYQRAKYPELGTTEQFENWLAPLVEKYKRTMDTSPVAMANEAVITIPVVVHVIHNNKPYGQGENIVDEQIMSQIEVLNEDFRRAAGTLGYNTNAVGADIKVEFCLAARTPQGEPTNGIVRHNRTPPTGGYNTDNAEYIKPSTQWDPNSYLNIWIVEDMKVYQGNTQVGEVLGYAQFPTGSGLAGLDIPGLSNSAYTDGVVIGHRHFGSYLKYPGGRYASTSTRGRTATHEVGHYLGLRHIYGDNASCSVDDYCPDTPNATSHLQTCTYRASCGQTEMKENYMNYTPETCQNIFTQDQKARIRTVLANSPRRKTLANSLGCTPPPQHGFDGKISIVSVGSTCDIAATPVVRVINFGTQATMNTAEISYGVGNNANVFTWNGNLAPGQEVNVTLPQVNFGSGNSVFTARLVTINGTNDENTANNVATMNVSKSSVTFNSTSVRLEITPDQYASEISWKLVNSFGYTVDQGSGYYNGITSIVKDFNLMEGECYTFTIEDEYEDGICCNYGVGSVKLLSGNTVYTLPNYTASATVNFGIAVTTADVAQSELQTIKLYPNPTSGVLNIVASDADQVSNYAIYNTFGQLVQSVAVKSMADLTIDTSSFANGVYLIKLSKDNSSRTLRFVKN